jgi:hypothetical protein
VKRWLRPLCHAAVAGWFVVALAGMIAASSQAPVAASEPMVRVQPVAIEVLEATPEPEVVPVREPELPARPEPALEPELREVRESDVARGSALLDDGGRFPAFSFDYETFASFTAYARAMIVLGARFVVVREREIVGAIDLESHSIVGFDAGAGYSPRARDYMGEPGLRPLAEAARQRFGERAIVMMLVPRRVDAGLFGAIAAALAEKREPPAGLREIRGRYERGPGGGVRLRVEAGVRRDGSLVPLNARFDLGQIARGAAA